MKPRQTVENQNQGHARMKWLFPCMFLVLGALAVAWPHLSAVVERGLHSDAKPESGAEPEGGPDDSETLLSEERGLSGGLGPPDYGRRLLRILLEKREREAGNAKEGRIAYGLLRKLGYAVDSPECVRLVKRQKRCREKLKLLDVSIEETRRELMLRDRQDSEVDADPGISDAQWFGPDNYMKHDILESLPSWWARHDLSEEK